MSSPFAVAAFLMEGMRRSRFGSQRCNLLNVHRTSECRNLSTGLMHPCRKDSLGSEIHLIVSEQVKDSKSNRIATPTQKPALPMGVCTKANDKASDAQNSLHGRDSRDGTTQ
jgi:hypothetical protein